MSGRADWGGWPPRPIPGTARPAIGPGRRDDEASGHDEEATRIGAGEKPPPPAAHDTRHPRPVTLRTAPCSHAKDRVVVGVVRQPAGRLGREWVGPDAAIVPEIGREEQHPAVVREQQGGASGRGDRRRAGPLHADVVRGPHQGHEGIGQGASARSGGIERGRGVADRPGQTRRALGRYRHTKRSLRCLACRERARPRQSSETASHAHRGRSKPRRQRSRRAITRQATIARHSEAATAAGTPGIGSAAARMAGDRGATGEIDRRLAQRRRPRNGELRGETRGAGGARRPRRRVRAKRLTDRRPARHERAHC